LLDIGVSLLISHYTNKFDNCIDLLDQIPGLNSTSADMAWTDKTDTSVTE